MNRLALRECLGLTEIYRIVEVEILKDIRGSWIERFNRQTSTEIPSIAALAEIWRRVEEVEHR